MGTLNLIGINEDFSEIEISVSVIPDYKVVHLKLPCVKSNIVIFKDRPKKEGPL